MNPEEIMLETRMRQWTKWHNVILSQEQFNSLLKEIAIYVWDCAHDTELMRDNAIILRSKP